ncbi:lipid A deacylase LpxR family protein [Noviherbaspirillum saxi]|uniref:Lipid A deacylase LpxR family protein n=1 Tax=Noviherbaspirillum saxi TaxID=2320863 RepID=A0A3A3FVW2_9BURK|nr:lipid A deacylase LpxR family protein [Noviherbaspirillum saxi]RJF98281.1 lipid A deacylase LpxR family protein [Noviherbaspirillum saxi]
MRTNNPAPFLGKLIIAAGLSICAVVARANPVSDFFSGFAQARESGKISHIVGIDNDTLLLNRNDGFYTSGKNYAQIHTVRQVGQTTVFGWRIAQDLYTASDIKLPPAQVGAPDHPYAGWLHGGVFKEVHREDGTYSKTGMDIGCLGPCAGGRWTQTNFHRVIDQPLPQGWSRQVRNEIGVVFHGELAPVSWRAEAFDLTPALHGRFGNIFTDIGAGFTARAGRLNLLPRQPALYGYLHADLKIVGYNATLQGGYFSRNNPHTVDPKRLVGEAEIGFAWNDGTYGARVGLVRKGNEIRGLSNSAGAQNYLHMQFSYTP